MSITLRFTRNDALSSYLIRVFTWSKYSHVEFRLADGYLGALLEGGVQLRPFNYNIKCQYELCRVDCTAEVEAKVIEFAKKQIDKPYDWSGVLGIPWHRDWHEQNHWFCSELVAAAFDYAKTPLIRDTVDRVTPQMLLELEEVEPI